MNATNAGKGTNAKNRTKRFALPLAIALLAVILMGWNLRRSQGQMPTGAVQAGEIPLPGLAAKTRDAAKTGDPEATMRQLRQLMDALRANNWNPTKVPRSLQTLPDAQFAELPTDRNPAECIAFPSMPVPEKFKYLQDPEFEPIAFYTDIYARYNRSYYKGDRSQSHPTGYVIVGWKDGRIEKVPIMQLREFRGSNPNTHGDLTCYPGMPEYATAKPSFMLSDAAK